MNGFSERTSNILKAIVQDYIRTAEPVSSKAIAMKYSLGVSPATIRNVMAELESLGFLHQPHTSAGRVPTEKSFRFYIDSMREFQEPGQGDKDLLKKGCEKTAAIEDILSDTAKALSTITNCAGLMFIPRRESFVIRHINLLPIDSSGLIVLLVSRNDLVQSKVVRMAGIEKLELESISNYLNSIAEGLTIRELRGRIVEEMHRDKNLYDELLAKALRLGAQALENDLGPEESDVVVEGKVNIIEQPEFRGDIEMMKRIFAAFEEKSLLVRILDKSLEESGIRIYLGSESAVEGFEGLSFVTSPYGRNETLGTLGVAGPVRMDYSRIIPLVDYASGLLSKVL
ncbi:MAG TPA: heat-inducible transcription repressor HrcA [Deltaproteobacteria bacterium]|nr:MAG: heat-inducible transcription repressor HrcA [Deltaproteobacteria bacterium GWA2_55_82]OGQ63111.1 MAG: heat-inducible transcription repressor HrcA [Deltaproteobacteria bacterium RIFCSPLOWO2_02_FULL_55_12]OIJ73574.1 MAG: heat-inducible transcription repressor HrcA [Deltaproteobacteria bacterium GWC2_55_46]HBG47707.1 heat-inducible transcription repressor HrcA [Deltaproteobacteria bacterium]HCY12071.1 heat-inducible transcription repressor HrcA [Deltaproteobacteria bacterium]